MTTKNIMAGFRNTGIYHMTHWQYPPRQWPQVKLLTMVRKVAFGVGFGVLLILETFCRNSLLKFQIHFFRFLDYFHRNSLLTFL